MCAMKSTGSKSKWKWMFKFSALPKRWMRVSAPVLAVPCVCPAFCTRWVAITR